MTGTARDPESHLPMRPVEFDVLLSLAPGTRHGYAILLETEERTGRRLELGTLYRALRRMESAGLIARTEPPEAEESGDERRRYYAITALGRAVAAGEMRRMERLVRAGRRRRLAEGAEEA